MELRNKKVLVTGADGFIGSHLTQALLAHGCSVRAFVYYNSFSSWGWLDALDKSQLDTMEVFAGDIRDPNGVREAMKDCDVVFHLAALIGIPFSYHSPDSYVDTNIKGTLNVLQAARQLGVQRLVVTSTSEVYGTARYVPIDENHPLQGQSPYSATKIGADRLAESFYRSFDTPVVVARPFNTYGPRQSARALIPTIITQLLSGDSDLKLGSTKPTRDFNYVTDITTGFLALAECDAAVGEEVNIATGTEYSVADVVEIVCKALGVVVSIDTEVRRLRPKNSEVSRLLGDPSKMRELTGWQPEYSFERGLAETVDWFRNAENRARYKAWHYNI
ncbi:NAD-dependent 4,6-dehydratase LegB [Thiocapsa marina]|uniref:dTDP-glucose 4,6-dehydratase n=1 Tax=Thiocapsa marina 5811 TaxID=768671 RepID=F9U6Y9_9GAMM|nr:NAD-dependent 4,6-dehydratase LegB [Thiocapsa marina]EGV20015.1 dTDP-glucose 4,6-dehydratase [Thiocapsa marina 5811]